MDAGRFRMVKEIVRLSTDKDKGQCIAKEIALELIEKVDDENIVAVSVTYITRDGHARYINGGTYAPFVLAGAIEYTKTKILC